MALSGFWPDCCCRVPRHPPSAAPSFICALVSARAEMAQPPPHPAAAFASTELVPRPRQHLRPHVGVSAGGPRGPASSVQRPAMRLGADRTSSVSARIFGGGVVAIHGTPATPAWFAVLSFHLVSLPPLPFNSEPHYPHTITGPFMTTVRCLPALRLPCTYSAPTLHLPCIHPVPFWRRLGFSTLVPSSRQTRALYSI